jgi:hypothetical protein
MSYPPWMTFPVFLLYGAVLHDMNFSKQTGRGILHAERFNLTRNRYAGTGVLLFGNLFTQGALLLDGFQQAGVALTS